MPPCVRGIGCDGGSKRASPTAGCTVLFLPSGQCPLNGRSFEAPCKELGVCLPRIMGLAARLCLRHARNRVPPRERCTEPPDM